MAHNRNHWQREIESLLVREGENGGAYRSRGDGDIHAPAGFSTIDVLNVLGELRASTEKYPLLRETVEFTFTYQNPDGSFKYAQRRSKLPCMTARIVAGQGRLGVQPDKRLDAVYQWFLETQAKDGGWRCATVRRGKSTATDASNPGTTLYIPDAFRFRHQNADQTPILKRGVAFLLRHWETRTPLGPCQFGIGSRFLKVEYPFLRYNLILLCLCSFSLSGGKAGFQVC